MEVLNVTRLVIPDVATDVNPIETPPGSSTVVAEETEEEDSFFELDIAAPDPDTNKCSTSTSNSVDTAESNENVRPRRVEHDCINEQKQASAISVTITDSRCNNGMFQQRGASASQGDKLFSKRKILPIPIEGLHRTQSPISLLKSAPKFHVFTFAKAKSIAAAEKAEAGEKQGKSRGNGLSTFRFKTEIQPPLTGSGCLRKADDNTDVERTRKFSSDNIWGPKRFSREVIQKYLKLLKPLYVKVSKKNDSSETVAGEFPVAAATLASPQKLAGSGKPPTGSRMKRLGKSRSASAAATCRVDSGARMDDSLVQLQDGIQSAILHCKRSLSASRDFSPLSRCDAGSAHDEMMVDFRRFPMD